MSYVYQDEKPHLFTDDGQRLFLAIRDNAHRLCDFAGCARMQEIIGGNTGNSWVMLACVDRLVELGELTEVAQPNIAGQHRIFVSRRPKP